MRRNERRRGGTSRAISRARPACLSISRASAAGCSCSSASSHDTRFTRTDDAEISSRSSSTTTSAARRARGRRDRPAEDARGHGRRGADRVLERDAERVQVPHRLDHGQHGAGEHPSSRIGAPVARPRPRRRRADRCRRPRRPRRRIADERDSAAGGSPDKAHRLVGEVMPVDDQLHEHVGARQRHADDAGSRERNGRIALNRCVTVETPRSKAACACRQSRSCVRRRQRRPLEQARRSHRPRPEAPGRASSPSRGRRPAAGRAAQDRGRAGAREDACQALRRKERPSTWAPRTRGPRRSRGTARSASRSRLRRGDERRLIRGHPVEQRLARDAVVRASRQPGSRRRRSRSPGDRRTRDRERPRVPPGRPTSTMTPSSISTSPGTSSP